MNVDTFDNRAGNLQWVSSSENGFLMNIRDKIVKGNIDNEAYIQYLNDLRIY
ncbi:hypothetical protein [Mammaliicoccus sciuri]|uniref:hypothetical protein n=1 Tax=Mammaliicoccus sciuri TaxID=1296 RepID=UPI003C78667C